MYSKEKKLLIIKDKKMGLSYGDLSKKYGIPRSSIQYIVDNYAKVAKKRGPKEKLTKSNIRNM